MRSDTFLCSISPLLLWITINFASSLFFAGLLAIKKYHESKNQGHRNICLIPNSAHGTNPASAQMCGMEVSIVKCDDLGNVDLSHLEQKINEAGENLASLMITYPSTHGVFEESISEICEKTVSYTHLTLPTKRIV